MKVKQQKSGCLLQEIHVSTWKWQYVNMDFVVGLPRTRRQYDSIRVVVDRFTKSAHFISIQSTCSAEDYARIYFYKIVSLHGVPLSIISDRGSQFTSRFWRSFQRGLGTQVKLSTAFHILTDGQVERTI